jgi:hypothetical protein
MNALLKLNDGCKFTDDTFSGWTQNELSQVLSGTVGLTVMTLKVKEFLMKHGKLSIMDAQYVSNYAARLRAGGISLPGKLEESAWPKGASVHYARDKIEVRTKDNEITQYVMNPIPVEKGRTGMALPLVLLCSLCDMSKGAIKEVITEKELSSRYGHSNSKVQPLGVKVIVSVFTDMMGTTEAGKDAVVKQLSMSGSEFYRFANSVLVTVPYKDYWAFHTLIAHGFFGAITLNSDKKMDVTQIMIGNKMVEKFPKGTFTCVTPNNSEGSARDGVIAFHAETGYYPWVWMKGVVSTKSFYDPEDGTAKTATGAQGMSRSFRGGEKGGVTNLVTCDGFASLMSPLTRRYVTMVGTVLYLLRLGKMVDVDCAPSEIPILHTSLNTLYEEGLDGRIKYYLPVSKRGSVHKDYLNHVISVRRTDSHYFTIFSPSLPACEKAMISIRYETMGKDFMNALDKAEYTVFTTVYSEAHFSKSNVFMFRRPWDFMGCVTTEKAMGFAYGKGGDSDRTMMKKIDTAVQWYKEVIKANSYTVDYFIRPEPFFPLMLMLLLFLRI